MGALRGFVLLVCCLFRWFDVYGVGMIWLFAGGLVVLCVLFDYLLWVLYVGLDFLWLGCVSWLHLRIDCLRLVVGLIVMYYIYCFGLERCIGYYFDL